MNRCYVRPEVRKYANIYLTLYMLVTPSPIHLATHPPTHPHVFFPLVQEEAAVEDAEEEEPVVDLDGEL